MSVKWELEWAIKEAVGYGGVSGSGTVWIRDPSHAEALLELVERVEAAKEHLSVGYPVESFQLLLVALSRITED